MDALDHGGDSSARHRRAAQGLPCPVSTIRAAVAARESRLARLRSESTVAARATRRGPGALLAIKERATRLKVELRIVHASASVQRILELTGTRSVRASEAARTPALVGESYACGRRLARAGARGNRTPA